MTETPETQNTAKPPKPPRGAMSARKRTALAAIAGVCVGATLVAAPVVVVAHTAKSGRDHAAQVANDLATVNACTAADRLATAMGDWHTPTKALASYGDYSQSFRAPGVDPALVDSLTDYVSSYTSAAFWQGVDAWGKHPDWKLSADQPTDQPMPQPTPGTRDQRDAPPPTALPPERERIRSAAVEDAITQGREAAAKGNRACVAASNRLHHK